MADLMCFITVAALAMIGYCFYKKYSKGGKK